MILGGLDEKEGKEGKREEFIRMEGGSCRSDEQERKECAGCGNKIHDKFLLKVSFRYLGLRSSTSQWCKKIFWRGGGGRFVKKNGFFSPLPSN